MAADLITCIHAESGLCPQCQAAFDGDESAFREYGDHPAGLARWAELQAEIDAERLADPPPADWTGIPF